MSIPHGQNKHHPDPDSMGTFEGTLDLEGATCSGCVYTIEHAGPRLDGVYDCIVDRNDSTIRVRYDGNRNSLERIVDLVERIGYKASIR